MYCSCGAALSAPHSPAEADRVETGRTPCAQQPVSLIVALFCCRCSCVLILALPALLCTRARPTHPPQVYKGKVSCTNSFAVPFEEDAKNPEIHFIDHDYLETCVPS